MKLLGLPAWYWLAMAAGGLGIGLYLRRRAAAGAGGGEPNAAGTDTGGAVYATLYPSSGAAVGTDPSSITGASGGPGGNRGLGGAQGLGGTVTGRVNGKGGPPISTLHGGGPGGTTVEGRGAPAKVKAAL